MPHLPGKPEKVYTPADVSGGERVPRLVRIAVTHPGLLRVEPMLLRIASAFAQGSPVFGSLKMNSFFIKVNCFCACSAASASLFNSTLRHRLSF